MAPSGSINVHCHLLCAQSCIVPVLYTTCTLCSVDTQFRNLTHNHLRTKVIRWRVANQGTFGYARPLVGSSTYKTAQSIYIHLRETLKYDHRRDYIHSFIHDSIPYSLRTTTINSQLRGLYLISLLSFLRVLRAFDDHFRSTFAPLVGRNGVHYAWDVLVGMLAGIRG
jgi:hypothetical protein